MFARLEDRGVEKPILREFGVEVGDVIVAPADKEWEEHRPVSKWLVTGIFPYVFSVVNEKGIKSSFQKIEYQLGTIKKESTNASKFDFYNTTRTENKEEQFTNCLEQEV